MNRFLSLLALVLTVPMLDACSPANASPTTRVIPEIMFQAPALNTSGDHVFAALYANAADAGTIVTIVDGGSSTTVPVPLAGTGMTSDEDGSSCITASTSTGRFTIAGKCGTGDVLLSACFTDVIGIANKTIRGQWYRIRSSTAAATGGFARKVENSPKADAGNVAEASRGAMGCVETIVTTAVSDTYEFRLDSTTAGDTVTVRGATLSAIKLVN